MNRALAAFGFFILSAAIGFADCARPTGHEGAVHQLVNYTNDLRAKKRRAALRTAPRLTQAAQDHACYMAASGRMSHTGAGGSGVSDRASATGYQWRFVAENVAFGYDSPRAVGEGWRKSRGHNRNMLDPKATQIGIGWARAGGRDYWVMVLAAPR